ncbi:DUF6318 family protein [Nocardioides sp. zg-DK7169]|uniref:DUF6318 family protein n=1 Tax=Nocardioides sp. zg-DK7169 TaxID=2736600 RepID=UPI001553F88A|nr:hypothetical protein [Nocardioides sp. zg-DK7169]
MVAAAVLVASSSACSEDPEEKADPAPAPTPTATTTPAAAGPVEPTLPPEAEGDDAAAAEAFVEYFWAMVKYAESGQDIHALRRLMSEHCEGCGGGIRFLREVFRDGGRIEGGDVVLSRFETTELRSGPAILHEVRVDITSTRQVVSYASDREEQVFPAGTVRNRFIVIKHDGQWLMDRWEVL